MASAGFRIFRRQSRDRKTGKPVTRFCARFLDEEGRVVKTVTLAAKGTASAALEAKRLQDTGAGVGVDPTVEALLLDFWRSDSTYARMKALRGSPLSAEHLRVSGYTVRKHVIPRLGRLHLSALTADRVERVLQQMADEGLNPRTINAALAALHTPVADWARKHRVSDPLNTVRPLALRPKERGILTVDEISKVLALAEADPRVVAAVALGALCGLRLGEARALRWENVDRERGILHIRENFQDAEGVKRPKCNSSRDVPLPSPVLDAMILCARAAPYSAVAPHDFVLWNYAVVERPMASASIQDGFHRVLRYIGIDDKTQGERNLVFHGLRHCFVSMSRARGLSDFVVQRLAGHKSLAMTDHYSSSAAIDLADAREALELPFRTAK